MTGAAVADAAVQIKNVGTGLVTSVMTDGQGRFNAPSLIVGEYEVTASKAGFQTTVVSNVVLTVGSSRVVDFTLQVGQAQQTVTVQGEVAQVDTTTSTVANLVERKQMVELPLNGRNFQQLITLAPGVNVAQTATSSFYGKGDTYSIAGGRPEGQAFLLDGTDVTNFFNHGTGGGSLGTSLGIDAIAEFQTLTNTYSAQFGGNGSVVNAVSKSGTNGFHGTAFEFLRNSALDARNFFDGSAPPPFRRNQFGGALGGPIKKDKAFFFVNYEGLRQLLGVTNSVTAPDAQAHAGYLPNSTTGVEQYVGFGSPLVQQIMQLYPVATTEVFKGGLPTGFGTVPQVGNQIGHENYLLARVDYTLSDKDTIFARYALDRASFINPFPNGAIGVAGWTDSEPTQNNYATVEERHIISPTVINVARVSFVRTQNSANTIESNPAMQWYPHLGGQDGTLAITGLSTLGPSTLAPYSLIQNKFAESDDIYMTRGAHNIKFGLGISRIQTGENQPFSAAGSFTFGSLAGFMAGTPIRYGGAFPVGTPSQFGSIYPDANRAFRETMVMPYINDDWKVNSKLTINIGVRWDFDTNPKTAINDLLVITNPPFNSIGGPISTGFTQVPNVWKKNPAINNWGPRFGFAWDPFKDHKTSIRGGFGDFHNVIQPRTWTSGYVTGPPFPSVIVSGAIPASQFPNPFVGTVNKPLPSNGQTVDYNTVDTPALYEWNLNAQRELKGGFILTVSYVGSHGSHLVTQSDQNPPIPVTDSNGVMHFGPSSGPLSSYARWSPSFGTLNALQANGTSNYNALQANAVHRFSHNVQAQVAYTWSHCIDNGSGSSGLETGGGPRSNPYNFAADIGSCTFDLTQALRVNSVWALPFKGNKLVEGWQVSGISSWTTGPPLLIGVGFDQAEVSGSAFGNERPNLNPGWNASQIIEGNRLQWYNPAAFSLQTQGTEGNLGRDILRGPGLFNLDFALLKDTRIPKISEQFVVQFRAEFFNILNHTNFGTPNLNVFTTAGVNGSAGLITNTNPATTARQIQFGLKLNF